MSARAWYAKVVAVGTAADQIGQIRASWPDVGGEYPDWIDLSPGGAFVMPATGDFVEVREREDEPGRYEWTGIRPTRMPAEVTAAHPDVAALLPPSRRCYVVCDGREGADGAAQLIAAIGALVKVRNDGQVQAVPAAGKQVDLGADVLNALDGVVTGACNCAFTGAPHPIVSLVVRAKKGP